MTRRDGAVRGSILVFVAIALTVAVLNVAVAGARFAAGDMAAAGVLFVSGMLAAVGSAGGVVHVYRGTARQARRRTPEEREAL